MEPSLQNSLRRTRRFGRVTLTALILGLGSAAIAAIPFENPAFAANGNGNGKGGGNGGGQGHGGGNGGGGNGSGHGGGNSGGNGHGKGADHGGQGSENSGQDDNAKASRSGPSGDDTAADDSVGDDATDDHNASDDDSLNADKLGKLNGFFHASPQGLANASPNSSIGRISHTFKDALGDYADAAAHETDPNAPDDPDAPHQEGPSIDDLGGILAGATNKPVTGAQVQAIVDHLAELNPQDESLQDFADQLDDETTQGIADAANASKYGGRYNTAPADPATTASDDDNALSGGGAISDDQTTAPTRAAR